MAAITPSVTAIDTFDRGLVTPPMAQSITITDRGSVGR